MNKECSNGNNSRVVSFFEFWPGWVMYAPVVAQWIVLSIRYRSLTLPFIANPSLTLSGMVGVPKSELMEQASGRCASAILPWVVCTVDNDSPEKQATEYIKKAKANGIELPFVCKPDIGCRGAGVKLVKKKSELENIVKSYPEGASLLCQKLSKYESEVGIFYVKNPKTNIGKIVSMNLKTLPYVTGDGVCTLGQLVMQDARAGQLQHLYYERHKSHWDTILKDGEKYRLVFSASHCRGAVFTDACHHIKDELNQTIDEIMKGLPEFYYGRLDVKFKDFESLHAGHDLEIVEINGASAESTHIWDKDAKFFEAIKTLMWQYRTLFFIGAYHRKKGKTVPTIFDFFHHWKKERTLTKYYPLTD